MGVSQHEQFTIDYIISIDFNEWLHALAPGCKQVNNCKILHLFIYFLFNNLFASKNITYKNAIQMTLKVLTTRNITIPRGIVWRTGFYTLHWSYAPSL